MDPWPYSAFLSTTNMALPILSERHENLVDCKVHISGVQVWQRRDCDLPPKIGRV